MQVVPVDAPRRCAGDQGSVLVEAAFVAPLFMYLFMGVLEFGMYFRNWLTLGAGVTDGARILAISGNAIDADYQALQTIKTSMAGISRSDITKIIVFDPANSFAGATDAANPIDAKIPGACLTMAGHATDATYGCNVYTPTLDWTNSYPVGDYNCTSPGFSANFCPTDRKVAKQGANGPPSFIGLYVEVNHKFITGMYGSNRVVAQTVITRCEPQSLQ